MSRGKGESKISPRRCAAAVRRAKALDLRIGGATLAEIAAKLGYSSLSSVHEAIVGAIENVTSKPADELRNLEAERLERLRKAWWSRAKKNEKALACYLRIAERYARLLGLDAPTKLADADGKKIGPVTFMLMPASAMPQDAKQ